MKIQKNLDKIFKVAAVYFFTSAGSASYVIGMIILFVAIPPYLAIPLIAGIGWVVATYQVHRFLKLSKAEELEEKRLELETRIQILYQELRFMCFLFQMRYVGTAIAEGKTSELLHYDWSRPPLFFAESLRADTIDTNFAALKTVILARRPHI